MTKILAALVASAVSFGAFAQTTTTAPAPAASGAMSTEKSSAPMKKDAMEKKAHGGKSMHKDKMAASKPAA